MHNLHGLTLWAAVSNAGIDIDLRAAGQCFVGNETPTFAWYVCGIFTL